MHNRKKSDQPRSDGDIILLRKKSDAYRTLVDMIFDRRRNADHSVVTLDLVAKLLRLNPDFYSLWNFRREIVTNLHPYLFVEDILPEHLSELELVRNSELKLSEDGIKKNPKAYGAWFHRYWLAVKFSVDFSTEFALCEQLLNQDQRNFHCWNYRRFLFLHCQRMSIICLSGGEKETASSLSTLGSDSKELNYSLAKIQENFSNYSAFHHRSTLIKKNKECEALSDILTRELAMVESAIFTEPDDQSAWWYHQFLFNWAMDEFRKNAYDGDMSSSIRWLVSVLFEQLRIMDKLLEVERDSKWALVCIVSIIENLRAPLCIGFTTSCCSTNSSMNVVANSGIEWMESIEALTERKVTTLQRLIILDPTHASRYRYILQK